MKVTSDTTLVVKTKDGIVEHRPGTVVEYPKEKAEELISRGLARAYKPAEPSEGAGPGARAPKPASQETPPSA